MKTKYYALVSMLAALSMAGFVHASEKNDSINSAKSHLDNSTDTFSYDVISGKGKWNLASTMGRPVIAGMSSIKRGKCEFEGGSVRSTVDFNVGSGTTVTLIPVEKYPSGVLTLIDISTTSGTPDEETSALKWEAGSKPHACVVNQGNYSTHRKITTQVLDYGKATQIKLPDQSVFEITASAGWIGTK